MSFLCGDIKQKNQTKFKRELTEYINTTKFTE